MEENCIFQSDDLKIEGIFDSGSTENGMIVTHPHPVYGGEMYNPVVTSIHSIFKEKEYSTLRFNFRGAGRSEGQYDNGQGEQRDLNAAMTYIKEKGIKEIDLAGYSFGSWINALAVKEGMKVRGMIMVSPPVAIIDFSAISKIPSLKLVITGSRDEIAPAEMVEKMIMDWNPGADFKVIDGADHFYQGYMDKLEEALRQGN